MSLPRYPNAQKEHTNQFPLPSSPSPRFLSSSSSSQVSQTPSRQIDNNSQVDAIATGCFQGCMMSFVWMFLFQTATSIFQALGVPCAGPLAAGCAGGTLGAVNAASHQRHRQPPQQQHQQQLYQQQ